MLLQISYTAENCGKWTQGNDTEIINELINELIIGPSPETQFRLEKEGKNLFDQFFIWDDWVNWVHYNFGVGISPESHEDTLRYYMSLYVMNQVVQNMKYQ